MNKYRVTSIKFDFEDHDFELPPAIQQEIVEDCLNRVWGVVQEDDLVDEITDFYGFCISSIDYEEKMPYVDAVLGSDPYAPAFKRESNLSE
tara:strand:+ start:284 stop:556 length:273 start_codon:yes stop_codon:yes gene_type:complete